MRGLVRIDPDHHCRHGNTPSLPAGKDRGGHAQFQDLCGAHASFEPRHGEAPASWHVVRKPTPAGRQADREPGQPGPLNATTRLTSIPARPAPSTESLNWAVIREGTQRQRRLSVTDSALGRSSRRPRATAAGVSAWHGQGPARPRGARPCPRQSDQPALRVPAGKATHALPAWARAMRGLLLLFVWRGAREPDIRPASRIGTIGGGGSRVTLARSPTMGQ